MKTVINDKFWNGYIDLVRDTVLPYQWDVMNDLVDDAPKSGAVKNFKIAAGLEQGEFYGMVFQDSDVAKWLEAVGYALKTKPDAELMRKADEIIDIIGKAQQPDGYLNTYFILKENELPENRRRFANLVDCHELYCLGHMIEAAVSYYEATGKRKLLDVVCRFTDLVDSLMGAEDGKMKGYPGHQEIELALVRLYSVTKEKRYLNLAKYFINERGKEPNFFFDEWEKRDKHRHWGGTHKPHLEYHQAHKPVREQTEAVGHAVRAVYMYAGMAAIAAETGDKTLTEACRKLWRNICDKQLYITGGIGQTSIGEAFTFDYDLPNDTVYSETCAAIGLIFFANEMLKNEPDSTYADIMELALYNTVLAGMSKDGKKFFYVNPLETWPEACEKAPVRRHVKDERQGWFACACCPPNVSRLLLSLDKYIYRQKDDTVFVNLFIGSEAEFDINGRNIVISQETEYPHDGKVKITVKKGGNFTLAVRYPHWLNPAGAEYSYITKDWADGDVIDFDFAMDVKFIRANAKVRANAGKTAVMRGPLVYCAEECDNGANLSALSVRCGAPKTETGYDNAVIVKIPAARDITADENLYYAADKTETEQAEVTLIPYYLWGNRGKGEMAVWLRG
jgi:hypothetical protein